MNLKNNKYDYEAIKSTAMNGPRVTTLLKHFEDIAAKQKQFPKAKVVAQHDFLERDPEYYIYHAIYTKNFGVFNSHGVASMPFVFEQCMRMGITLCRFAELNGHSGTDPLTFYGTSTADGTHARTIAEYSEGRIVTLTDSPNKANQKEFYRHLHHKNSFFHLGSFFDITPDYLVENAPVGFKNKFDFIWENTTLQMYGNNRSEQIAYIKRVLKEDGIISFLEKLNHEDSTEYARREKIKDDLFKSKYFTTEEIQAKRTTILEEMEKGQLTLSELSSAIKEHFQYAYIVWNSTNFYEIIASNNKLRIQSFLDLLPDPYVPDAFACERPMVRSLFSKRTS